MKSGKMMALFLVLALLLSILAPASAARLDHQHSWREVSRTEATCTAAGSINYRCSCGETKKETIPKKPHSWGGWQTSKKATCTEQGEETRKCAVCGKTETQATPKAAHAYGEWEVTVAPTCVSEGARQRVCGVCGHVDSGKMDRLNHDWTEWETVTEATDRSAGLRARTCRACGERETESFDPEGTLRFGEKGDAVQQLQVGLTCYGVLRGRADGSYSRRTEEAVKALQQKEGMEPDGVAWPAVQALAQHKFGEWEILSVISPFSKGEKTRVCERCGYVEHVEEWPEPTYQRGDRGDGVLALQQALDKNGYKPGKIDGIFSMPTENAVKQVESDHGVPPDGIAWPGVQALLGMPVSTELPPDAAGFGGVPIGVILELTLVTPLEYPYGFTDGSSVGYSMTVRNNTEEKVTDLVFWDDLRGEGKVLGHAGSLAPFCEVTRTSYYKVTPEDALAGSLTNIAHVTYQKTEVMQSTADSDALSVDTFAMDVSLEKSIQGGAEQVFSVNDTVNFVLTVRNNSDFDITAGSDQESTNYGTPLSASELFRDKTIHVPAHESVEVVYPYTVTVNDAIRGKVADSSEFRDGYGHKLYTDAVTATVATPPEYTAPLTITQEVKEGADKLFKQNDTVTFLLKVHNPRPVDITTLEISSTFEDEKTLKTAHVKNATIKAGEDFEYPYVYTVTSDDVIRGFINHKASCNDGLGSGPNHYAYTDWVKVNVLQDDSLTAPLIVTQAVQGGDGQTFTMDDTITYEITVENPRDAALTGVEISLKFGHETQSVAVAKGVTIPAHQSVTKTYAYTVTAADTVRDHVSTIAFSDDGVSSSTGHSFHSEWLTVPIAPIGDLAKPLEVELTCTSGAEKIYQLDETITFDVKVTNPKSLDLNKVEFLVYPHGYVKGGAQGKVFAYAPIAAHASETKAWSYTVTSDDMEKGYFDIFAGANDGFATGTGHHTSTEEMRIYLGSKPDSVPEKEPEKEPDPEPEKEPDPVPEKEPDPQPDKQPDPQPNPDQDGLQPLVVTKSVTSGEDKIYAVGETVTFGITVYNPNDVTLTNVGVYDHLNEAEAGDPVAEGLTVAAHETWSETYTHEVNDDDLSRGYVSNYARAAAGIETVPDSLSETVRVMVGRSVTRDPGRRILSIVKSVNNLPARGFFLKDEIIDFKITVTNQTGWEISDVRVTDPLSDAADQLLDVFPTLASGASAETHLYYTVDMFDVGNLQVVNTAYVSCVDPFGVPHGKIPSNPCSAPTGELAEGEPAPTPGVQPAEAASSGCVRTLVGKGRGTYAYTLDYCPEHRAVNDAVRAVVGIGSSAAWDWAVSLWTDALNQEYEDLLALTDDQGREIVLREKECFLAQVASRKAALALETEDQALISMRISEMLMNRTADLCYAAHNAPAPRPDSRRNGMVSPLSAAISDRCGRETEATTAGAAYTEIICEAHRQADQDEEMDFAAQRWTTELDSLFRAHARDLSEEETGVLLADRRAFGAWLDARGALLRLFYPGQPDTVSEVLADTVRERVIDLCSGSD